MSADPPDFDAREALVGGILTTFDEASLTVTGDCMRPALLPGERVRLLSTRQRPARLGDIVLVNHPQGLRLHRVIWKGPRTWRTKGDRSLHADPRVEPRHVLGTVFASDGGRDVRRGWRRATLRSLAGAASARLRSALLAAASVGLLLAVAPAAAQAQTCSFGAGGTLTGVLNTYYPGVGTAAVNATSITVDTAAITGATGTPIAAGDMLLVIQMQDAQINTTNSNVYGNGVAGDPATGSTAINNSGLYEYVVAASAVSGGGVVTIVGAGTTGGLINAYATVTTDDSGMTRRAQRTFQVIRVPRYQTATLGSGLTAAAWNGRTGGVLAIDVAGTLTLGGTVSVNGLGFRGGVGQSLGGGGGANTDYRTLGATANNAYKGEGIAGTPRNLTGVPGPSGTDGYPLGDKARGAPGNGGGGGTDGNPGSNDENAGGGGGGNGGTGGQGGNTWSSNLARGGHGGSPLATVAPTRILMGGGGGAGDVNNCGPGGGANGGGIVLLRAETIGGTGTLSARGASAASSGHDGAGGGGAGGSIVVVSAAGSLAGLIADVGGGTGGYANLLSLPAPAPGPTCTGGTGHGPGGGGGGGVVLLSAAPGTSVLTGGANGLTNVTAGVHGSTTQAYGATAGTAGVIQTNLTRASVPGVETCLASTRASIVGLRVEPSGTVEFVTAVQRGTVGFNVYGLKRRRDATRTRLNDHLIVSPMPDSLAPIFYRVETGPVSARFLLIEEIERTGRRRLAGPFSVTDAAMREAFESVEARVEATGRPMRERAGARFAAAGQKQQRTPRRPGPRFRRQADRRGNVSGVKVEVQARGLVSVPLSELEAAGLAAARPRQLRVWNAGRPVAAFVGTVNGTTVLRFEADTISSDYTDRNVYVVTGPTAPPVPSVPFTRSGPAPMPGGVVIEQNSLYAPFLPREADPWVWDFLVTGSPAGPFAFDLPPAPAPGTPVGVRVIVTGLTDHAHSVEAALNGVSVGRIDFTGRSMAEILGHVPAESLRATANELTLAYTAETTDPDEAGVAVLDRLEVGVARGPAAGAVAYELSPYDATLPDIGEVNYLIVTHELFRAQADAVAALKAAEGHRPLVVDVARAYDRFSAGVFEAGAVKALIRHVRQRSPLQYVLLVGDDTFDYRDLTGLGLVSYIPSLDGWDGEFGRVPSENRFADLDGDGRPEVAIGRLPVQTVEQAEVLVDKIDRQSAVLSAAHGPHVIAVDNDGPGDALFHREAATLADRLPAVTWADLAVDLTQARSALLGGLAAGAPATHYFGHGGYDRWADEGLLTSADATALAGSNAETVVFTWACEVQWYQYDLGASLNETLLLTPQGGALAAVGPTGITDPAYQSPFQKRVYGYFLAGVPLGEAMRRAKFELMDLSPAFEPVAEGWSLLGDPALKLP